MFPDVRHEKVPAEDQPGTPPSLPGSAQTGVAVHLRGSLRPGHCRAPGPPLLDHDHQYRRSRHAQGQTATK